MDYWNTLLGNALMGTDRQAPTPPNPVDKFTMALSQLDWQQPERSILAAAGAITLYQQVGQQPKVGQQPITTDWTALAPCGEEEYACCSEKTARHLSTVMVEYPAMMPELLGLMATAQQHIPAQLLPKLLNFGRQRSELRPQIAAVIGKRGQWLARHNPVWAYGAVQRMATFDPDAVVWKAGNRSERALFLHQWRQLDADAAREALEAVWSSELAKDRADLIASLACNVSMADEPFLEKVLCDRAKAVRQQAIELLIKLPESQLCQRMAERLAPFVNVQANTSGVTINIVLPKAFDPTWEEDGITAKQVADLGEKAGWLYQMLTCIPLSHWPGEPAAIAQAMAGHKWQTMLVNGWGMATLRQQNPTWAAALVNQFDWLQINEQLLSDLIKLLPSKQQEQILTTKVPTKREDLMVWLDQVAKGTHPWSLDFSHLVLEQIFKVIKLTDRKGYGLNYLIKEIAMVLHPDLTPAVAEAIQQFPENSAQFYWIKSGLDEFQTRMCFRNEMYRAFNPSG